MIRKIETQFDAVTLVLFFVFFFGSVCLTSISWHVLFFFLPAIFLIKKIVFRTSFFRKLCFQKNPLLSIIVWQLTLLPWIMALFHGDFDLANAKLQWINHQNSWIILYSYLASNYFLFIAENTKTPLLNKLPARLIALLVFLLAFEFDFIYAIVKYLNNGLSFERWQGSSGNPQLWAIQASIMLLIWLFVHNKVDELTKSKIYTRISLTTIILAIFLAGSISNFIGLSFASLAWLLASPILALILALLYLVVVNYITIKFLLNYHGDLDALKNLLAGFSNKILPRLRLWFKLLKEAPNHHIDYIWGMGLDAYNTFMASATAGHHKNAHNLYFHNCLTNGLAGLYLGSIFLFNSIKQILSNKYLLAIALYIISSSVFDCALTFIEVQILFWLVLPLLCDMISKSSDGTLSA